MLRVEAATALGGLELDVALEVGPGRCLALAGPSGAGKTTVLRTVAGLHRPDRGLVTCAGETWLDSERRVSVPAERRRCGYLFQEYALFPHLSARQNVAYGMRHLSRGRRRAEARALLERFGVGHLSEARPARLSGGERQRVALARALALHPRALLLDEPLAALDARTRASAGRELARVLREAEVPALLVTHDFAEAALLGDEVAVIDGGRVLQRGSAAELAAAPASAFVADFTGASVLTGTARAAEGGLTRVSLDGGGEAVCMQPAEGRVAIGVFPWEVALEPPGTEITGSASNRLDARVVSVTAVGNRVRVGLETPQPLAAEITAASLARLDLAPGTPVIATWKAAATRLVPV